MLRIGYKASAEQFDGRTLLGFAVAAERAGFDSVFVSDHFQPWRHEGGHAPFCFSWLGAAGASTSRVVLGTSVTTPTFRHHPSTIAQCFATLGQMFPERIILGIGTGESLNEVPPTGMHWPEPRERTARFRELVKLIRELWSHDRVSFEGQFYRTENATIYDRPEKPVPIYIAGAGPLIAKFAGREGDGFICTSGKGTELYRDILLPNVAEGRAASGRGDIDRTIEMKVSFDSDIERAREDTRFWAALALSPEEKMTVEDPVEMQRLADNLPIERVLKRWIVSNDPDVIVEGVRPYVDLGFRHLVFHAPGFAQERFMTQFSAQVMPKLRAAFGG